MLIKHRVKNLAIFVLIIVICYAPFLDAGSNVFKSLIQYSQKWYFNASLFDIMSWITGSPGAARVLAVAVLLGAGLVLFIRYRRNLAATGEAAIYQAGFIMLGCIMVLTPVLHPWYVCWIIPFLVIIPNRAWILLSGSVFLAYLVLKGLTETGIWEERTVVKLVEYAPFYGLLLYDRANSRSKQKGRTA